MESMRKNWGGLGKVPKTRFQSYTRKAHRGWPKGPVIYTREREIRKERESEREKLRLQMNLSWHARRRRRRGTTSRPVIREATPVQQL